MKIGMMLPTMQSLEVNAMALQGAEALGVDDVWLNDHLLGWTHPELWPDFPAAQLLPDPDAMLDPFVTAGALSTMTDLRIGFSVADVTRTRGPDLARAGLTLAGMCRGGFVLGIGAGEAESLLPFGYEWKTPIGNLERALIEVRSLFDTGQMPGDQLGRTGLSPDNKPAIWLAASKPRGLELTGRYADGWLPIGTGPEAYAEQLAIVQAAALGAGRPMPEASCLNLVLFGESRAQIGALLEELPVVKLLALFLPAARWAHYGLDHPSGQACRGAVDAIPHELDPAKLRAIAPRIPLELFEEFVIVGNAQEVAAHIEPLARAGAQHVVLADVTGTTYDPSEAAKHLGELGKLKTTLAEL
jgi:phthiodiolone/phenolphthiodiolone dimycocerosates ketoreductase